MHVCMYMRVEASPVPQSLYTLLIEEDYLAKSRDLQFHLVSVNHFCIPPYKGLSCLPGFVLVWGSELQFSSYLYGKNFTH